MREKNDVHFILSQYFFFPTTTTIWRKTEKTKEVFINRSQQGGQKRGAFFEKKTKKGFNALIFEFDERALKSFCNRTLAAAFAAFSSSAFCLLSIFLYSLKFCVCFCM